MADIMPDPKRRRINLFQRARKRRVYPRRKPKKLDKPINTWRFWGYFWDGVNPPYIRSCFINEQVPWRPVMGPAPINPEWHNDSGFYSIRRRPMTFWGFKFPVVLGLVRNWGRVLRDSKVYRSRYQQVIAFYSRMVCVICKRTAHAMVKIHPDVKLVVPKCADHAESESHTQQQILCTTEEFIAMLAARYGAEVRHPWWVRVEGFLGRK